MIRVGADVQFRHPLIRSAVYNGAPSAERRTIHDALHHVTTRLGDEDRQAWHLAGAAAGTDEDAAIALEKSADRAAARGGFTARSLHLARAAELSPHPDDRDRRFVAAAQAALTAGATHRVRPLLDHVSDDPSPSVRGDALLVRAVVGFVLGEPGSFAAAPALCLAAAHAYGQDHPRYGDALAAACQHSVPTEHLMDGTTVEALADTVAARPRTGEPTSLDMTLDAFAAFVREPYADAVPKARLAIERLLADDSERTFLRQLYILGVSMSTTIWDRDSRLALLRRGADDARRRGALQMLDGALFATSMTEAVLGDLAAADRTIHELQQVRAAIGGSPEQQQAYRHPELLALHGDHPSTRHIIDATRSGSSVMGLGAVVSIADVATVTLDISSGRYAEAAALARGLIDRDRTKIHSRVLPDLVEAASRAGDRGLAERGLALLTERAEASGTPWALGLLDRCRALLADGSDAETHHRAAVERLAGTDTPLDAARAQLLFGEWLRRAGRRQECRTHLSLALDAFESMGTQGFADRARGELAASGITARKRTVATRHTLTPQEDHVARLAGAGYTNAEIGERLFISARTVDYHLRKVYRKLDVESRRQLRDHYQNGA